MRGFRFRSILYCERCAKKLSSALSKFKCLAAKHSCLNPLWTYFLVTCPRMDQNDGITAGGCAWMSPEGPGRDSCRFNTLGCWLFICSEDVNEEFSSSRNRFLRRTPTSQDHFAFQQLLWPDFSTLKSFDLSTKHQVCTSYRLLCVIGTEMIFPPSLKLHDTTLTDQ